MRRLLLVVVVLLATFAPTTAQGFWSAASTPGGAGRATINTLPQVPAPLVVGLGNLVTVTWGSATLPGGGAVPGYEVRRRNSVTGVSQPVGGSCAGLLILLTCVDTAVPPGRWRYYVVARAGTNWVGPESPASLEVIVLGLGLR